MRVYFFVESEWAVKNICKQRLKVCRFFDLNDPFELLGGGLVDKDLRKKVKGWAKKLNERHGLLCFSTSWKNPLMWSHYGDRHKGMCLGFDVQDSILKKIIYTRRRIPLAKWKNVGGADPPKELEDSLFVTKYAAWRYENEQRMVIPLDKLTKEGDLYFMPFDGTLKLVEIIAGHRCCVKWKSKIERAVKAYEKRNVLLAKPKLIKARLAFKKFEVVTQKWGFDNSNAWQECGASHPS
ncbi:MAG TPA: DUF2971 domain-containing protein [Terracidiphilus sp.]|nr:DUF2971 domain-containing protein [Terracidiphilus sp.]